MLHKHFASADRPRVLFVERYIPNKCDIGGGQRARSKRDSNNEQHNGEDISSIPATGKSDVFVCPLSGAPSQPR